jgi:hypothetical protein
MRGTKWFCIVLGCFLIVFTIIPAPFPLALQSCVSVGVQQRMRQLFDDGSISVDPQQLAAKHAKDRGGTPNIENVESAQSTAGIIMAKTAFDSISGLGFAVSAGTFLMGILWLAVGLRIPSRLPAAPN